MTDIILQIIMISAAIGAGYVIRAITHHAPKRGKNGRFIKD